MATRLAFHVPEEMAEDPAFVSLCKVKADIEMSPLSTINLVLTVFSQATRRAARSMNLQRVERVHEYFGTSTLTIAYARFSPVCESTNE